VRNCHELGECRPFQEAIVHCLEVSYLELQVFSMEVSPSLEGYRKGDLINGCCHYSEDYAMEQSLIGAQCCTRQTHLVEYLQEQVVQGATSIDKDLVELYILDIGASSERVPP
jgi:hypothetical protein